VRAGLAAKLRDLRETLHITQQQAAEAATIEFKHWQLLESKKSDANPTLATLVAIASALHVELHELLRFAPMAERRRRQATAHRPRGRVG
jgi:transcriptional regulator with XRE-family HTH domain